MYTMPSLICKAPQTNDGSVPHCPYGPHIWNEDHTEGVHVVQQDLILLSSPLLCRQCRFGCRSTAPERTETRLLHLRYRPLNDLKDQKALTECISAEKRGEAFLYRSRAVVLLLSSYH